MNSAELPSPDVDRSQENGQAERARKILGELASARVMMTDAELLKQAGDKAAAAFPDEPKWAEFARERAVNYERRMMSQARMDHADMLRAYEEIQQANQGSDSRR